jgi:hypothetical protein
MQQSVQNVESQFMIQRRTKGTRLPRRRFRANDDLSMLKGEHVSWTSDAAELLMQSRHLAIAN